MFSSPLLSRIVAVLLLAVALAAVVGLIVEPLASRHAAASERARIAAATVERYRAVAGQADALADRLAGLRGARAASVYFMDVSSEATASAALQERLKAVVAGTGAVVTSLHSLAVERADDHRRVPLRAQFSADTRSLQKVLYGLETSQPALVVQKLFVRARSAAAAEANRPLDVELEVVGFLRGIAG